MTNEAFRAAAKKAGIFQVGFLDAAPFAPILNTGFCSIVVALFPYFAGEFPHANLSCYTFGEDYHRVVKRMLADAARLAGLSDFLVFADTGPHIEKQLAYLAGLGVLGMHSLLISPIYGSYCFIGYLLCNQPFVPSHPLGHGCAMCGRCRAACPGGAILGDGTIDAGRCLSFITQKKGALTPREQTLIAQSGCAFGCDICQRVCPHNRAVLPTHIRAFSDGLITRMDADTLAPLSNRQFMKIYGNRAFSWRGKAVLERNLRYIKPPFSEY